MSEKINTITTPIIKTASKKAKPVKSGNLIVITGPSGVGKGTITAHLLQMVPGLVKSVSATTRPRRPQEQEGKDYFFKSEKEFTSMIESYEFMEHAEFAGYWYGTPKAWVDQQLALGNDVLLEIEVQGAKQIRQRRPDSLLIFLAPPSLNSLKERLEHRGTESKVKIAQRLKKAEKELKEKHLFYYEVINDNLDTALTNLIHIVYAERCRIKHQLNTNSQLNL